MRIPTVALFVVALLTLLSPTTAKPAPQSPLPLSVDTRLTRQRVTLLTPHAYIGEVLEIWSKQTGVTLRARESDDAANETVSIFVREMSLYEAMTSLESLLSYRHATWTWHKLEEDGKIIYELRQSNAARELTQVVNRNIQADFEKLFDLMMKGEKTASSAREQSFDKDSRLEDIAKYLLSGGGVQNGVATIRESLSPENRDAVLRGQKKLTLSVSSLGASGQKYVKDVYEEHLRLNPNSARPLPTHIHLQVDRRGLVPTFNLLMGNAEGGEGYGVIGGKPLEQKWTDTLQNAWIFPGDARVSEKENISIAREYPERGSIPERIIAQLEKPASDPWFRRSRQKQFLLLIRGLRLWQLHDRSGIPIMAHLSRLDRDWNNVRDPGDRFDETVHAYLKTKDGTMFWHKWKNETLLVTSARYFVHERDDVRPHVPWSSVTWLRHAWITGDGYFSPEDMARAATLYSVPQLTALTDHEFENLGSLTAKHYSPWRTIGRTHNLLSRLAGMGAPVSEMERAMEGCLPIADLRKKARDQNDRLTTIRFRITESKEGSAGPRRIFWLEAVTEQGKVIGSSGFFQKRDENALIIYHMLQQYQEGKVDTADAK